MSGMDNNINVSKASIVVLSLIIILGVVIGKVVDVGQVLPLIFILFLLSSLSFAFFKIRVSKKDRKILSNIFILGLLIRLTLAVVFGSGTFAEDDLEYQLVGWKIARLWETGIDFAQDSFIGGNPYTIYNGFIYHIFGYVPLLPRVINCFVGSFIAIYIFFIANHLFNRKVAILAALFTEFFPSLILWSTLNLRDTLVTFALVLLIWELIMLQANFKIRRLVPLVLALIVLKFLRGYLLILIYLIVVIGVFILGIMIPKQRNLFRTLVVLGIMLFLGMGFMYQKWGLDQRTLELISFEQSFKQLSWLREQTAEGGSAFYGDIDISTPWKALKFLPIAITYFLFAPFPWDIRSGLGIITLPEMLIWYFLFLKIIAGTRFVIKNKLCESLFILVYLVITTTAFALILGNIGTAYRFRAMVLPFFLILSAVGMVEAKTGQAKPAFEEVKKKPYQPDTLVRLVQ